MNPKTTEYITAVGALIETLGMLRTGLHEQGFTRAETNQLCSVYIMAVFQKPNIAEEGE